MVSTPLLGQAMISVSAPTKPVETSSLASITLPAHASMTFASLPTLYPPIVVVAFDSPMECSQFNQMEAIVVSLQVSVAKKDTLARCYQKATTLADEVYSEVMPTKYRWPVFTKFNGS